MSKPDRIRVAIVEDDESLRRIFGGWMQRSPAMEFVGEFPDAESAMLGLGAVRPEVVLVDIQLPGLDGIECVRRLKGTLGSTQFMMLTVYEDADRIFKALEAGAAGYLLKRTTQEELIDAIVELRKGGSPMTSAIARKVVQSFQRPAPVGVSAEMAQLSPREREILGLLAQGYLYKEIASDLGISGPTVNAHIRNMYEKLQVHSRAQAVARYMKAG
jgi:DNA-binding NarL/FixJ family response regulator